MMKIFVLDSQPADSHRSAFKIIRTLKFPCDDFINYRSRHIDPRRYNGRARPHETGSGLSDRGARALTPVPGRFSSLHTANIHRAVFCAGEPDGGQRNVRRFVPHSRSAQGMNRSKFKCLHRYPRPVESLPFCKSIATAHFLDRSAAASPRSSPCQGFPLLRPDPIRAPNR